MDHPIVITPQDVVNTILAVCGAIITISAALTIILKAVKAMREPDKKQNERITALEDQVEKIEDRLKLGNKRFEADAEKVGELEVNMRDSVMIIMETLQALTSHAIDGNNIQELKEARKQMNEYLLKR